MAAALLAACAGCAAAPTPTPPPARSAAPAGLDASSLPVIPAIGARAAQIYKAGVAAGNNPRVFAKVGDCMTETPHFLAPFSEGRYALGEHAALEPAIKHFLGTPARSSQGWTQDSFATTGLAAFGGFNVAGPLDATWANPKWCTAGESPLACDLRVSKPSIALIMFGTNDASATEPEAFVQYYRQIVGLVLANQTLPVLSTFPTRPENPDKSRQLNRLVAQVAREYDVPLINLNRALEPLPNHGVDPKDTTHLTLPPGGRADDLTPAGLQAGFNVRNLVTLQTLDAILQAVK